MENANTHTALKDIGHGYIYTHFPCDGFKIRMLCVLGPHVHCIIGLNLFIPLYLFDTLECGALCCLSFFDTTVTHTFIISLFSSLFRFCFLPSYLLSLYCPSSSLVCVRDRVRVCVSIHYPQSDIARLCAAYSR